jgi:hypothetical protein
MTDIEKLDYFLIYIAKDEDYKYSHDIYNDLKTKYTVRELNLTVEKLYLDKYIDIKYEESANTNKISPPFYCRITFHGLFFLRLGGYKSERKHIIGKKIFDISKLIAGVTNAIVIIIIAFVSGIYVPYRKSNEEKVIQSQNLTIDSLQTIIQEERKIKNQTPNR